MTRITILLVACIAFVAWFDGPTPEVEYVIDGVVAGVGSSCVDAMKNSDMPDVEWAIIECR